jgi:NAD(P)-dependent dehydrogenase (short-subunit alcohol dehydrogenase family)
MGFLNKALLVGGIGALAAYTAGALVRRSRYFDLHDKVAVVTGGSRGLGQAIARELVSRGAKVAICARDEFELRLALEDLERRTGQGPDLGGSDRVMAVTCDVNNPADITRFLGQVRERLGPIDVLINNAGVLAVGPEQTMKLADFRLAMQTNFEAPLQFILQVRNEMRQRRSGRIVNICSFGGKIPSPHLVPYSASKFALVGLSEGLRTELIRDGVYVTTVCPGLIRTGSPAFVEFRGDPDAEHGWFNTSDNTPIISISPERLARQVVDAMQDGDAELISPFVASWQVKLYQLFPGLGREVAALINRALPGGTSPARRYGRQIEDRQVRGTAYAEAYVEP